MEDILTFLGMSVALVAYLFYSRKDFENWKQLSALEKSHVLRFPLLAFAIVVMLFVKICFDL